MVKKISSNTTDIDHLELVVLTMRVWKELTGGDHSVENGGNCKNDPTQTVAGKRDIEESGARLGRCACKAAT